MTGNSHGSSRRLSRSFSLAGCAFVADILLIASLPAGAEPAPFEADTDVFAAVPAFDVPAPEATSADSLAPANPAPAASTARTSSLPTEPASPDPATKPSSTADADAASEGDKAAEAAEAPQSRSIDEIIDDMLEETPEARTERLGAAIIEQIEEDAAMQVLAEMMDLDALVSGGPIEVRPYRVGPDGATMPSFTPPTHAQPAPPSGWSW